MHESQTLPLNEKANRQITGAHHAAQQGYRELQETARKRFAPGGLRGSERVLVHFLIVRDKQRAEPFLAGLRASRRNATEGPSKDEGRFTVRDSETDPGEARQALEAELDALGGDWRQALALQPPPEPA